MDQLKIQLLDEKFAISKMPQFAELPSVFAKGEMCFVMRTDEDLTIICPEFMAPDNGQQEIGYRCIRTSGQIPLNTPGVLISLRSFYLHLRLHLLNGRTSRKGNARASACGTRVYLRRIIFEFQISNYKTHTSFRI